MVEQLYRKVKGKFVPVKNKGKAKLSPEEQLKAFMSNYGYTVQQRHENIDYKRKDGKTIKVLALLFSNGRTYYVSKTRFWKVTA